MSRKMIVIGGGVGGLATGIYGCRAGFDVDVLEKHTVAGGECTGWDRKGCHIDNCIHWLTGTKPGSDLHQVWREVGALDDDTAFAPVDRFFTVRRGGQEATLWYDLDRTRRELLALAPEDADEINKFLDHVRRAECCEIPAVKPMEAMGPLDYLRLGMRMKAMPKVMKEYGSISLGQLAARFKNPTLQMLIGGYMPQEYAAYALVVSYATMTSGNGLVPQGGSKAMAQRMVKRLEELGGRLHLGRSVARILVDGGRATGVELADGTSIAADVVVFAADMSLLYGSLIDGSLMPEAWRQAYGQRDAYPVMSGLQAAFVADADAAPEGTILFQCEPLQAGAHQVDALSLHAYGYEPAWAPEGKVVVQMNISQSDADFQWWESLSRQDYVAEKARIAQAFAERAQAEFPTLAGRMELLDCWTPLTYVRYCGAYRGSYMGFVSVPGVQPPPCDGRVKGVEGLYLAGQWATSPGGLPIAVTSGKFAVQRILHDQRKNRG